MGAWSHEPFGNDDALDWVYDLDENGGYALIEQALDAALAEAEYLEVGEGCNALAAAEILAAKLGRGTQTDHPDQVSAWLEVAAAPDAALLKKAQQAVARVLGEDSELRELWDEASPNEWVTATQALQAALAV